MPVVAGDVGNDNGTPDTECDISLANLRRYGSQSDTRYGTAWSGGLMITTFDFGLLSRKNYGQLCTDVYTDYCVPAAGAGADTWRHLRSSNSQLLAVPRYRLNTCGRRAFSVAGPTVWNFSPEFHPGPDHQCRLFQTFA